MKIIPMERNILFKELREGRCNGCKILDEGPIISRKAYKGRDIFYRFRLRKISYSHNLFIHPMDPFTIDYVAKELHFNLEKFTFRKLCF